MAINVEQRISTRNREGSLDFRYGPYSSIQEALDSVGNKIDNGVTIGIIENNQIVDYTIQGVMSGQSPTSSNFIKKISDATITFTQTGQQDQTITLNQSSNKTINIVGESQVQADWEEKSSSSKAYIQNKPTIGNAVVTLQQADGKTGNTTTYTTVGSIDVNATTDATITIPGNAIYWEEITDER